MTDLPSLIAAVERAARALTHDGADFNSREMQIKIADDLTALISELERRREAERGAQPVARRWKERINCGQGQFIESDWSYTDYYPDDELERHPNVIACEPLYAAPPAPDADRHAAAMRLKEFIRATRMTAEPRAAFQGCKMLSEGDACQCPLCDVDRLRATDAIPTTEQDATHAASVSDPSGVVKRPDHPVPVPPAPDADREDARRLDEMEQTRCYPFWDGTRWVFIVGEGSRVIRRGEGATVREAIDAARAQGKERT